MARRLCPDAVPDRAQVIDQARVSGLEDARGSVFFRFFLKATALPMAESGENVPDKNNGEDLRALLTPGMRSLLSAAPVAAVDAQLARAPRA
eukprot:CAMPEP_0180060820 /NCGR_PEP_ID=MMETSP0985-20121206/6259_1 /TAXON_ID=483367 /ORGANISM="non described non described, Strain CCMP 2436" /LENGTH=91 /DNA_ID=CAMNT_0021990895 /DNA_START=75 /DNA_END=349 /DNA_ORIENTATION=-